MTNTTNAIPTKRIIACAIFNDNLQHLDTVGDRLFRQTVLIAIEKECEVKRAPAATLYNYAKKKAVATGLCDDFSNSANAQKTVKVNKIDEPVAEEVKAVEPVAEIVEEVKPVETIEAVEEAEVDNTKKWKVVEAATGIVVGTYESRAKAREVKADGQKVEKIA